MIVMRRAQLPRGILRAVGNLPQLESLMLYRWFPALSAGDLAPLGRLRNLKTLDLNWARLDESTLGELDPLDRLETLDLSSTQVTDATLGRLVARHPRLTSLRLDGRLLTDEGLAVLTQLPRLSRLRLGGDFGAVGQLTDVGLATLARDRDPPRPQRDLRPVHDCGAGRPPALAARQPGPWRDPTGERGSAGSVGGGPVVWSLGPERPRSHRRRSAPPGWFARAEVDPGSHAVGHHRRRDAGPGPAADPGGRSQPDGPLGRRAGDVHPPG